MTMARSRVWVSRGDSNAIVRVIQPSARSLRSRRAIADGESGTVCARTSLVCESSRCARFSS